MLTQASCPALLSKTGQPCKQQEIAVHSGLVVAFSAKLSLWELSAPTDVSSRPLSLDLCPQNFCTLSSEQVISVQELLHSSPGIGRAVARAPALESAAVQSLPRPTRQALCRVQDSLEGKKFFDFFVKLALERKQC